MMRFLPVAREVFPAMTVSRTTQASWMNKISAIQI
jgi:hypothetical protein